MASTTIQLQTLGSDICFLMTDNYMLSSAIISNVAAKKLGTGVGLVQPYWFQWRQRTLKEA